MNIPDEVIEKAAVALFDIRDDQYDLDEWDDLDSTDRELYLCQARAAAPVIAEWARKEALKEAAAAVRSIPCWADGKGNSGFDVGPDPVRVVRETVQRCGGGS